jgi:hypothetical protein
MGYNIIICIIGSYVKKAKWHKIGLNTNQTDKNIYQTLNL